LATLATMPQDTRAAFSVSCQRICTYLYG